ncbi:MAG TPA: hypothetical protein VFT03_02770, partial [Rubrobacteraceae bacterium]|nr:hypothetical protein [Rubrobacteraceae bacterium]
TNDREARQTRTHVYLHLDGYGVYAQKTQADSAAYDHASEAPHVAVTHLAHHPLPFPSQMRAV